MQKVLRVLSWVGKGAFSWLKVLQLDMSKTGMLRQASAMAYVTLLSLVPSLAVTFSLLSFFMPSGLDTEIVEKLRHMLFSGLTEGAGDNVTSMLEGYIDGLNPGAVGVSGFVGLLLTLILLLRQIEISFNQIWRVEKHRNPLLRFLYFSLFLGMGIFLISLGYSLLKNVGLRFLEQTDSLGSVPGSLEGMGIGFLFFFITYKVVPNCRVRWKPAACGALFSAVIFTWAGKAFVYYGANIANYQVIYGALAALPLFLIWLYLCWVIILFGAVLSRRIQTGL